MENLPIIVNGVEKYASGITKDTSVDDIKFAMLSASQSSFTPDKLEDYGIFERFQSNEKLLDGKTKMYKIMKKYKSLPGDQLSQVKFYIKRKINSAEKIVQKQNDHSTKGFKFCTLSPNVKKTWNQQIALSGKTSFVRKQLQTFFKRQSDEESNDISIASIPSSAWSSDCDEENQESNQKHKRYASIRQLNKMKKSIVRKTNLVSNNKEMKEKLEKIQELKSELELIQQQLNKNSHQTNSLVLDSNFKKDETITLKKTLIKSLESELKQMEKCQIVKQTSSSSVKSTDSGVSSCYSDEDDDKFFKSNKFETLV